MFEADVYIQRRRALKKKMQSGLLLFLGNGESPMNYAGNVYPFRQDSSFLYYWGIDTPNLAAVIDLDSGKEILFGDDPTVDDVVWSGPLPTVAQRAEQVGVRLTRSKNKLHAVLEKALQRKRTIHFLPQYRQENKAQLEELLGIRAATVNRYASQEFIRAVVDQRSVKAVEEVEQIEKALDITYEIHTFAMKNTHPGKYEREVAGMFESIAFTRGGGLSFPPIFTIRGETLHNNYYGNRMKEGDLVVCDSGAESAMHYAGDITRSFPVSGKYTSQQKEIYEIVLKAQMAAIDSIKPGEKFRDVHLLAARIITAGLQDLGLMKGDVEESVASGAHALFFPHGLGHMMGLDVHDMENLGEDFVGYDRETRRSKQFGLGYLRFARTLRPGFVLTVEPGIYFIPELHRQWRSQKKNEAFIDFAAVESYLGFGGIRIEDNVLVTPEGHWVLGKPIPKTIAEVESAMGKG